MAQVNTQNILNKCIEYSKTNAGKQKMRDVIIQKQRDGDSVSSGGSEILTPVKIAAIADEFIALLRDTAASYDLPLSVMEHFDSLKYVMVDLGGGRYECDIYFADNLSRESLDAGGYQSSGINNIIALFNNGYVASSPKYGWWHGHSPIGDDDSSPGATGRGVFIKSKQARPSLHFMQRAIEDFAAKYQSKYPINIILNNDEYDGNYAGSLNGIITEL